MPHLGIIGQASTAFACYSKVANKIPQNGVGHTTKLSVREQKKYSLRDLLLPTAKYQVV